VQLRGSGDGHRLIVGPTSTRTRRALGPLAWAVLEELALSADAGHGARTSRLGVRDLASVMGLSKDTAARGLGRLLAAGLVVRVLERDAVSGRFGAARYDINLPEGIDVDQNRAVSGSSVTGDAGRGKAKKRASYAQTSAPRQLSLLASDIVDG
jgi:hypothetical protein